MDVSIVKDHAPTSLLDFEFAAKPMTVEYRGIELADKAEWAIFIVKAHSKADIDSKAGMCVLQFTSHERSLVELLKGCRCA